LKVVDEVKFEDSVFLMVDQDHQPCTTSEYTVSNDNVLELKKPGSSSAVRDALSEVPRDGTHTLQALEAEVTEFLARHQGEQDAVGRARMMRNGHLPERTIQTGLVDCSIIINELLNSSRLSFRTSHDD
jgi:hypothetical protein